MQPFIRLLFKDFLLLVRDFWGAVLLFLMPWALVLMMTYLQDSTFRSVNETRIPLYLLNNDRDSLGNMVSRQLQASPVFEVSTGDGLSPEEVERAVSQGKYLIAVIIPEQATARLRENVSREIRRAFNGNGGDDRDRPEDRLPGDGREDGLHRESPDADGAGAGPPPLEIKLLVDPTAKQSFRVSLIRAMRENALTVQNKLLLNEIAQQVNRMIPFPVDLNIETDDMIVIRESYAQSGKAKIIPNSTQHNVPAWSMFAVFFIVISLAGNMIRECEIGCFNRLMTVPCSFHLYILSKVSVYLCVCLLQLALMILTGMYLIPLLGLPALKLGHSLPALFILSVSSSLAAIGYGLAIGSIARTNQQASVFGAVSVVMLAAVGGVWIPTFLMPRFMQVISYVSPLNWGLNGFSDLFVRDAGLPEILPHIFISLLFFLVATVVSYRSFRRRRE
jgi:ABC-2 type transport system permease protein